MKREEFIHHYITVEDRCLEIGPLNRPLVKKSEFPMVSYSDIRSTEEIKKLYGHNDYLEQTGINVDIESIVNIDYVLKNNYKETFNNEEKFDVFVASHVIEHVPDILGFFADITNVLKPGATVLIVYPDRRYCFDHYRSGVSFRDAYDVYQNGNGQLARLAMDFYFSAVGTNDPELFWKGKDIGKWYPEAVLTKAEQQYIAVQNGLLPDDAHYWIFSDLEFLRFLYDGIRADMLPYTVEDVFLTAENQQEYYVVLKYAPLSSVGKAETLKKLVEMISEIDTEKRLYDYRVENDRVQSENNLLQQNLSALTNSNCWKMTKPLRNTLDYLKSLRNRLSMRKE